MPRDPYLAFLLSLVVGADRVLARMDFNRQRKPRPKREDRPRCGARTRRGDPCRALVVWPKGGKPRARCRMHGGLSTGPRTAEGRERIAESNRRRAAARRAELEADRPPAKHRGDPSVAGSGAPRGSAE